MRLTHVLATTNAVRQRIRRVLVANRGEIALRVMHTARYLGIETVAVYSDVDADAQHVKFADHAIRIGEADPLRSYLNGPRIVEAARQAGAQAIHPGYGFLSENHEFAALCENTNLKFIGPSSAAIKAMGQKNRAKQIMIAAGVPTLSGYNGAAQDDATLSAEAEKIGYPVMIKPVYGGGGKGMRIASSAIDFADALASARSESIKAFGNAEMIVERFIKDPRHVEVQIFGDSHGNYVHLWERDCSVQRRHQKIIEEAPAPGLSYAIRAELGGCSGNRAVDAARAVDYEGAGTVEFVLDKPSGAFYFMEMNTRLQVEHPVSEAITGIDLVDWQFRVANGEAIPLRQAEIPLRGNAVEARVYAEEFDQTTAKFLPVAGRLEYLRFPLSSIFAPPKGGLRIDAGVVQGDNVTIHYDPMIAKVIAWGETRDDAIRRLDRALAESFVGGLHCNVAFVRACLSRSAFVVGDISTGFVDAHREELLDALRSLNDHASLVEVAVSDLLLKTLFSKRRKCAELLHSTVDFFRLNHHVRHRVRLNERSSVDVEVLNSQGGRYRVYGEDWSSIIHVDNLRIFDGEIEEWASPLAVEFTVRSPASSHDKEWQSWKCKAVQLDNSILIWSNREPDGVRNEWLIAQTEDHNTTATETAAESLDLVRAPIPGLVEAVLVKAGDRVRRGQDLVVMNAMKMEFTIKALCDAVVEAVECTTKATVKQNAILIRLKSEEQ